MEYEKLATWELKNMYKEYTEESPDYNPELIEKEKVEDYFPPKP